MSVPKEILDLVKRFNDNLDAYCSGEYNETQLRREFLDPFFTALGWDIDNRQGFAEAYKDVIHEDAIRVGGAVKAPDYCFRIGGARKFFLEAKKPSVSIKDDPGPAYQLRRYAWSAKLPLSILSDFEELAIYDCRVKPTKDDPAATARIFYCTFREYANKWDWLVEKFSREAILKGSFDRFAESSKGKKGTTQVDAVFLDEIEGWRKELAQHLALRNPKLTQRELNFTVQRIIDRIIFLRICEDRGIEDYGRLRSLTNGDRVYPRLCQLFGQADDRYNSGLFHFKREKDRREPPDELTLGLAVDDRPLKDILRSLYYPDSPYEFSVLSADILGQVYEQFLGKVIRLTEGHRAVIEDKPEVKKAGGVYYTPNYIVDYIVQQTVGKQVEGKTPKQAAALRVLDPACGSGSFLIGAYQYLLDWHRDWYTRNDPAKWAKGSKATLHQTAGGGWKLSIAERKRILLNNIFGVDIDTQAVEVTKLSLLLKVLEGETEQSLQPLFRFLRERALPDLGDNIKCGNSLIGPEFYQQAQMTLHEEDRYRINVFDWHSEDGFPDIMKAGGFDAVIGNPPYGASFGPEEKEYLQHKYASMVGKYDSYGFFIERSLLILKNQSLLGFITPHTWLTVIEAQSLRGFVLRTAAILEIVRLPTRVFRQATVNTILAFFRNGIGKPEAKDHKVKVLLLPRDANINNVSTSLGPVYWFSQADWVKAEAKMFNIEVSPREQSLMERIRNEGLPLRELCDFCVGVQAYDSHTGQSRNLIDSRAYHADHKKDDTFRRELNGNDVSRYQVEWTKGNWISYGPWLAHPRQLHFFGGPRILVREITGSGPHAIHACFTDKDFVNYKTILNVLLKEQRRSEGYHDFYRSHQESRAGLVFMRLAAAGCRPWPVAP